MTISIFIFLFVVFIAFVVEATMGFGATIIVVTLGMFLLPLQVILPAFVPLNMCMSLYLAIRYRKHTNWTLLLTRIIPLMVLGMPLGMVFFRSVDQGILIRSFGIFVVLISGIKIATFLKLNYFYLKPAPDYALTDKSAPDNLPDKTPPSGKITFFLLTMGGIIHGAYGTGGPMVVYVASRELSDKRSFRSTLVTLWPCINIILISGFALSGELTFHTATISLLLILPLLAGLFIGEWLHKKINQQAFQILIFLFLLLAGLTLIAKG